MLKGKKTCEIKGCTSTHVETEIVSGHPLTLCVTHGPEWSDKLTNISFIEMKEWARRYLTSQSVKKWNS